ncbi:MAG: NAD(P)H-binding protein [Acidobacteriia bacterium]|nr:NAD(P)H-binding protein [Terriglobia bacterium]
MRVFIAGASGVLGRRLIQQLTARGHSVIGQVRSPRGESVVRAMGGEPRHADLFDADALAKAAEGCDTMIHAAMAIPTKHNVVPADWALKLDQRHRKRHQLEHVAGCWMAATQASRIAQAGLAETN